MQSSDQPGLLSVRDLCAWYGESQVLHGMSFDVPTGSVTTLVGRNGAGKSTSLKSIMGLVRRTGSIRFGQQECTGDEPERVARRGIAYCPEERGIFSSLSVMENLMLPPVVGPQGMALEQVMQLFPNLQGRESTSGTRLSGGEQQMLAIGRILRTGARLLLLDEPTEGLAPVIVRQIGRAIHDLKARGYTVLLVEQSLAFARRLSERLVVVERGRVVDQFDGSLSADEERRLESYLRV